MDPKKVEVVTKWPKPKSKHNVQQFLGFVNFYCHFIRGFASIAHPLHALTGRVSWRWTKEENSAFIALKAAISTAPVLAILSDEAPYCVEEDSSGYATGAVLSQQQEDSSWHPIAFLSNSLSDVERNYDIHDQEMLSIMCALDEWQHYLMGATHKFEIWTDHRNLQYFRTACKLNRRQACWAQELAEYDFKLVHRPGRLHGKPDALLHRPDHDKGDGDNDEQTLLNAEWFHVMSVQIEGEEEALVTRIRNLKQIEGRVCECVRKKLDGWEKQDRLILWRNRIYVPKERVL